MLTRDSLWGDVLFHVAVVLVAVGIGQLSNFLTAGSAMKPTALVALLVFGVAVAAVSLWHSRRSRRGRPSVAAEQGHG